MAGNGYAYLGSLIYQKTPTDLKLEGTGFSAGRIVKTSTGYAILYYTCDYQGSVRAIVDEQGNILEQNDYYPFGSRRDNSSFLRSDNRWLYNSKESQEFANLNVLDYGARMYDPMIGSWFCADPAMQFMNPYLFCGNNPVCFVDPDGEFIFSIFLGPVGAIIDAACWGAVTGAAGYTLSVATSPGGFNNWNWSQFGQSVGYGALSGAATYGVGQMFGSLGSMGNGLGRAVGHGVAQGSIAALQGNDFMSGFASGSLSSLAGSAWQWTPYGYSRGGMYAFSALAGGVGSVASGGEFWQGAAVGAMNAGLNHLQARLMINGGKGGYRVMANESKRLGVEVSGHEVDDNQKIILEPTTKNTKNTSISKSGIDSKGRFVMYKGQKHYVNTHVHTHPSYNGGNIGISTADISVAKTYSNPIKILYNSGVYLVNAQGQLTGPVMKF